MRRNLNLALPSLVLIAVACVQIWRAKTLDQTPWKGGGFGMFATSDTPGARFLRISLVTRTGEHRVEMPSGMQRESTLLRTVPTARNAAELAARLAALTWIREEGGLPTQRRPGPDPGSLPGETQDSSPGVPGTPAWFRPLESGDPEPPKEAILDFEKVRVEVWKYSFTPGRNIVRAVRIQSSEANRPAR